MLLEAGPVRQCICNLRHNFRGYLLLEWCCGYYCTKTATLDAERSGLGHMRVDDLRPDVTHYIEHLCQRHGIARGCERATEPAWARDGGGAARMGGRR